MIVSRRVTLTNGTPVNLYTGTANAPADGAHIVTQLHAQLYIGSTHAAFLMLNKLPRGAPLGSGNAGVPAIGNTSDVSEVLSPGTATDGGRPFVCGDFTNSGLSNGMDIGLCWVDGTTGDVVVYWYDLRD